MIQVFKTDKSYAEVMNAMPNSFIIDVRYYKGNPYHYFSPFYRWGDVPIRYSEPDEAISIAAMMEGLRVTTDINKNNQLLFKSASFQQLIINASNFHTIGFIRGIGGHVVYNESDAINNLLYPSYRWVLDHKLDKVVKVLRMIQESKNIVILDYHKKIIGMELYTSDITIGNLLKAYIEGSTPYEDVFEYRDEYRYYTNHKRISGYKKITTRVLKDISELPSNKLRQLTLPFD